MVAEFKMRARYMRWDDGRMMHSATVTYVQTKTSIINFSSAAIDSVDRAPPTPRSRLVGAKCFRTLLRGAGLPTK